MTPGLVLLLDYERQVMNEEELAAMRFKVAEYSLLFEPASVQGARWYLAYLTEYENAPTHDASLRVLSHMLRQVGRFTEPLDQWVADYRKSLTPSPGQHARPGNLVFLLPVACYAVSVTLIALGIHP